MSKPKGLQDLFGAGVEAGESILSIPKTAKNVMIVGVSLFVVVTLAVIGTMAFGIGSGKIDVNELADTYSKTAIEASKNMPAVVPL